MTEPPILPYIKLPKPVQLPPRMVLLEPKADPPQYRPVILPSAKQIRQKLSDQQASEEDKSKAQQKQPDPAPNPTLVQPKPAQSQEITTITIPGTDIDVPVPRSEIISTAVITAGASSVAAVAGTLLAGRLFQWLQKVLKPIITGVLKRLAKLQGKNPAESVAKQKWRQHRHRRRASQNQV